MITMDPLYLLLIVEFAVLSAAAAAFLIFRSRKIRRLYREAVTSLIETRHAMEELKKKFAAASRGNAERSPAETPGTRGQKSPSKDEEGELEDLRAKLAEAAEQLKEKTRLLTQLQAKFDDLEKEYLILYHQQQKSQSAPGGAGPG